ncbi:MAG TPA: hypothetical protein VNO81_11280, partial [Candidatus Nitrosotenuis sp.]|nr:hypothetical protein [Candidatus Nitrosotenuis sp.]
MATRKTPLHPLLEKREAVFGSYGDWLFALRFGEVAHEYRAARSGSALADWGFHALTRVAGPDRRDFLQRLLTNDIPQQPGQGVHAFLLTSNGKPLIEAWVYQRPDDALLEVPRALHSRVVDQLERYHFREKLEIQDVSGQFAGLAVLGPRSRRTLEATGLSVPELAPYEHLSLDWRGTL